MPGASCAAPACSGSGGRAALRVEPLGEIEQPTSGERIRLLGDGPDPLREILIEYLLHDAPRNITKLNGLLWPSE